ncbi:hypothetical protein CONPUDRAFT_80185 [Coniophora puteana RWD-64-598 SS2]|uniref:Uncharacterized protein n=1 Tax=Coniophora puteana (strain RWD-64-598) TaxID=741705 RepID=A0A5M3N2Y2_CONPW|nr:uncharacterized protein CONPUDRAFT_80185 [Coniophora puteana RWD-64-598 SS2]EIW85728.1 hypothetical protein CONPUDRAFT_80185 [Coniophora puteana RWD-64-598 SS2]
MTAKTAAQSHKRTKKYMEHGQVSHRCPDGGLASRSPPLMSRAVTKKLLLPPGHLESGSSHSELSGGKDTAQDTETESATARTA